MTSEDISRQLKKQLQSKLSLADVKQLCFDLNIDYDELAGDEKSLKIQSLIIFLRNRDRLDEVKAWLVYQSSNHKTFPNRHSSLPPQVWIFGTMLVTAILIGFGYLLNRPQTAPSLVPTTHPLATVDIRPTTSLTEVAGRIVFTSYPSGTAEIFVMNLGLGGEKTQLTKNEFNDMNPRWSPDGSTIIFDSDEGGDHNIWVMDADGLNPIQVTDHITKETMASFSPDGSQIVFTRENKIGQQTIWMMNNDGSNAYRIEGRDNSYPVLRSPVWHPNGDKIIFYSSKDDWNIYTINPDGSGDSLLTEQDDSRRDYAPEWSPDGLQIVYHSAPFNRERPKEIFPSDIYIMNSDGTNKRQLTNDMAVDRDPSWSPDGQYIIFVSNRSEESLDDEEDFEIYLMKADGSSRPVRITNNDHRDSDPDWTSP